MTNLVFELQREGLLREGQLFQPFKLVSLWDMLRFYAHKFIEASLALNELSLRIKSLRDRINNIGGFPSTEPVDFCAPFAAAYKSLTEMELFFSAKHAARSLRRMKENQDNVSADELDQSFKTLNQLIIDELEDRLVFMVRAGRAAFYDKEGTILGEDLIRHFPDLSVDAAEAGNCFALGRYTACVFHLMRVMERMVQKMGRKFRIKELHKKTWGGILGEVKHKIEKMPRDTKAQDRKKNMFHGCYALLDAVCRATRNPTMHPKIADIKETYTEEEAKDVMDRTKRFVEDFIRLG